MSDLIERLNDAWRKLYGDGDEHDVCDTIAEAAAALEAAWEDAARYRWLRDKCDRWDGGLVVAEVTEFSLSSWPGDNLNAAIDNARGKGEP